MGSVKGQPIKAGGQYPNVNPMEFHRLLGGMGLDPVNTSRLSVSLAGVPVSRRDYADDGKGAKVYYTDAALLKMLSSWPSGPTVVDFGEWQDGFCTWMVLRGVYQLPEGMPQEDRVGLVRQRGPVSRATHIIARQPQSGERAPGWLARPLVIENMSDPGRRVRPRRALLLPLGEAYDGSAAGFERMVNVFKPRQEQNGAGIFGDDVCRRARLTTPEAVIEAIDEPADPAAKLKLTHEAFIRKLRAEMDELAAGAVPEWLAPGLNHCLVDGAWRLLVLDSRLRALLEARLDQTGPVGSTSREVERGKEADALYRLEDSGLVLVIDDSHEQNNKRRKGYAHG